MSRSITSATSGAVTPGQLVTRTVITNTAVTAGDYVYQYTNAGNPNYIGFPRATVNVPTGTGVFANNFYTQNQTYSNGSGCFGPVVDGGVYTGSSKTAGTVLLGPTQLGGSTSGFRCPASPIGLTNGNIVVLYNTNSSLFFQILSSTGSSVVAQTSIGGLSANGSAGLYAGCAMANGGFVVVWFNASNNFSVARYNSSGTQLVVFNNVGGLGGSFGGGVQACTDSTGGYVLWNGPNVVAYNSGDSYAGGSQNNWSAGGSQINSFGANSGWTFVIGQNTSTNVMVYYAWSPSTGATSGPTNLPASGGGNVNIGSQGPVAGCLITNAALNTFSSTVGILYRSGSTNLFGVWNQSGSTLTNSGRATISMSTMYFASMASLPNAQVAIAYINSSNTLKLAIINTVTLTITNDYSIANNASPLLSAGLGIGVYIQPQANGDMIIGYCDGSTTAPIFVTVPIATLVNNSTIIYGNTTYTPNNNYTLLGVALNSASANGSVTVAVNGTANLNANYPDVSASVPFDYTDTGTKGFITGRTAILRGLE